MGGDVEQLRGTPMGRHVADREVTVFTAPAKTTLAAQTGAKDALAAKRVVVRK